MIFGIGGRKRMDWTWVISGIGGREGMGGLAVISTGGGRVGVVGTSGFRLRGGRRWVMGLAVSYLRGGCVGVVGLVRVLSYSAGRRRDGTCRVLSARRWRRCEIGRCDLRGACVGEGLCVVPAWRRCWCNEGCCVACAAVASV